MGRTGDGRGHDQRDARRADLGLACPARHGAVGAGPLAAQLRTLLRHSDIFLTAWDGDALIGCARVLTDFTVRALICDVIVDPAYQGHGIGRMLVEAIEAHPALADRGDAVPLHHAEARLLRAPGLGGASRPRHDSAPLE